MFFSQNVEILFDPVALAQVGKECETLTIDYFQTDSFQMVLRRVVQRQNGKVQFHQISVRPKCSTKRLSGQIVRQNDCPAKMFGQLTVWPNCSTKRLLGKNVRPNDCSAKLFDQTTFRQKSSTKRSAKLCSSFVLFLMSEFICFHVIRVCIIQCYKTTKLFCKKTEKGKFKVHKHGK
jgi:hypothetical protein